MHGEMKESEAGKIIEGIMKCHWFAKDIKTAVSDKVPASWDDFVVKKIVDPDHAFS